MIDALTRPERFTELSQARERAKTVKAAQGCLVCANRAFSFAGSGFCKVSSMTYPRCLSVNGSVTFTPDFVAIKRQGSTAA